MSIHWHCNGFPLAVFPDGDDLKSESRDLNNQVDAQLAELDPDKRVDKKKITALKKDKFALSTRIANNLCRGSIGKCLWLRQKSAIRRHKCGAFRNVMLC